MKKSIFWVSFFFVLQSLSSLSAVDIDSIVNLAKQESEILQMYTLNKKAGELTLAKSDVEDVVGVKVSGGVGYQKGQLNSSATKQDSLAGNINVDLALANDQ
ncbi:MAG: hypothetical protein EOM67_12070, partial [Spirochaetia bacterium]|nr:hypothetical protein [Spirochaetia bacterium]